MCIRDRKYMSPKIQNELAQRLSIKVKNMILKRSNLISFFCKWMDTTQDINRNDELNQVITYVSISEEYARRLTNIKINEMCIRDSICTVVRLKNRIK